MDIWWWRSSSFLVCSVFLQEYRPLKSAEQLSLRQAAWENMSHSTIVPQSPFDDDESSKENQIGV